MSQLDDCSGLLTNAGEAGEVTCSAAAPAAAYLAAEIVTAAPHRLRIILCDGAIRLCREAIGALDAGEFTRAADLLGRARRIICELRAAGRSSAWAHLAEAFEKVDRRLIEAEFYRRREAVREGIGLLYRHREMLTASLRAGIAEELPPRPSPSQRCWIA